MARQYFCWKVRLTFGCGCVEYTPTTHQCGLDREGCTRWQTNKTTEKECDVHRGEKGGGLHASLAAAGDGISEGQMRRSFKIESGSGRAESYLSHGETGNQGWAERAESEATGGSLEGYYLRRRV